MNQKRRPDFKISCKSKESGKFQDLMAFWRNEKGIGGVFDKAVSKFVVEIDGQLYDILPQNVYLNMREELPEGPSLDQQRAAKEAAPPSDNIPF